MVYRLGGRVCAFAVAALLAAGSAFAQDPVYDQSGGQYGRGFFAPLPFERIDTVTGNVFLSFTDLSLPGDGQTSLSVVRTYNSRDGKWRMGIGGAPLRFVFNLPNGSLDDVDFITADGAKHNAESASNSPTSLTQGFWQFTKATKKLEMPNGMVFTYGHLVTNVGWHLTEIKDPFDNVITLTWASGTDQLTRISQWLAGHARYVDIYGWTDDRADSFTFGSMTWNYTWSTALSGPPQLTVMAPPGGAKWFFTYGADPQGVTKMLSLTTVNGGTVTYTWALEDFPTTPSQRVAIKTRVTGGRAPVGNWYFNWQDTGRLLEIIGPTNLVWYRTVVEDGIPVKSERLVKLLTGNNPTIESETMTHTSIAHPVSGQVPVVETMTTVRDGVTSTVSYTYGSSDYSNYGQPTQIVETGAIGTSSSKTRTTTISYNHSFSKYIRGRVAAKTVTVDGLASTESYAYDSTTGFLTSTTSLGITTSFAANAEGHTASVTDAANRTTSFAYDWGVVSQIASPSNAVVVSRTINLYGQVAVEAVSGTGSTTVYAYDAAGRVTSVGTTPGGREPVTTAYTVTNNAWVKTTATRGGVSVETDLDGWGRATHSVDSNGVQSETTYNGAGQVVKQSRPYGGAVAKVEDTFSYDALGRRTDLVRPDGSYVTTFYNGLTVGLQESLSGAPGSYQYRGTTQHYSWFGPGDGQLNGITDALGNTWSYAYNGRGQLTGVQPPGGSSPVRTWTYDAQGRPTAMTQPESGTSTSQYNAVGNVTYTQDARGATLSGTSYTYDTNHRLVSVNAPGPEEDVTTTYDSAGRTATVANGVTQTTLSYDAFSRVTARTDVISGRSFAQSYVYDAYDNLIQINYPRTGRKVFYNYTAGTQRLATVTTQVGSGTVTTLADTFVYRGDGSLASYRFGNNQTASFSQDSRQRPLNWKSGPLDVTYAYDHVSNVTGITDARGEANSSTYTYDLLDRIATSTTNSLTTTFSHSATGDRQTQVDAAGTTTFTYDSSNRLCRVASGSTCTFGYDAVGSLTSDPSGASYTYNASNKMQSSTVGGQATTYTYGAGGMRAVKTGPDGKPHLFVYGGGGGPVAEWVLQGSDAIPVREYVYLGSQLLASFEPQGISPPGLYVTINPPSAPLNYWTVVNFTATAGVVAGSGLVIDRVEYYNGGIKIGQSSTGPTYSVPFTVIAVPSGPNVFIARVVSTTATGGKAVASVPITLTVQ